MTLFFPLLAGWALWRKRLRDDTAFLLLWALIPPLLLYAMSLVWRPCIFPRYTLHCVFAIYLLGGIACAQVKSRGFRVALYAVAGLLFGYQILLLVPGPQRTDWRGAVEALAAQKAPKDLVLVQDALWKEVLQENAKLFATPDAIEPLATGVVPAQVAGIAETYLWAVQNEPAVAWIVVQLDYYASGPSRPIEEALEKCPGLKFTREELPGFQHLCLYRVTRDVQAAECAGYVCPPDQVEPYVDDLCLAATAVAYAGDNARAGAMFTATQRLGVEPQPKYMHLAQGVKTGESRTKDWALAVRALTEAYNWRARGMVPEEESVLRRAVKLDDALPSAWQDLGLCLTRQGKYSEAAAAFGHGMDVDPMLRLSLGGVATAVGTGDKARVDRAFNAVEKTNTAVYKLATGAIPEGLKLLDEAVELDPSNVGALLFKGLLLAETGEVSRGLESLNRGMELDTVLGERLRPLIKALYERADLGAAREEVIKLARNGFVVPDMLIKRVGLTVQELNTLAQSRP
jgi:tetratricopeptide (TPR) repeat protein